MKNDKGLLGLKPLMVVLVLIFSISFFLSKTTNGQLILDGVHIKNLLNRAPALKQDIAKYSRLAAESGDKKWCERLASTDVINVEKCKAIALKELNRCSKDNNKLPKSWSDINHVRCIGSVVQYNLKRSFDLEYCARFDTADYSYSFMSHTCRAFLSRDPKKCLEVMNSQKGEWAYDTPEQYTMNCMRELALAENEQACDALIEFHASTSLKPLAKGEALEKIIWPCSVT